MATKDQQARYRAKQSCKAELERYGFVEGTPPTEAVRKAVREAVDEGHLEVPAEGYDDGSKWPWHPDIRDRTPSDDELATRHAIRDLRQEKAAQFNIPIGDVPLVRGREVIWHYEMEGNVEGIEDLRAWKPAA